MKSLLTSVVLTGALVASIPAQAGNYQKESVDHRVAKHEREYRKDGHYDRDFEREYRKDKHRKNKYHKDGYRKGKHYDRDYHRGDRYDRHWDKRRFFTAGKGDRVRLDIPVNFRGEGKLRLKRMARQHYAIDLDEYRLVRVVFDHRGGRKRAAARLYVGQQRSDLVYLHPGRNVVYAPRTRANARWQLALDNARVNNVRLVLEPRYSRYARNDDRRYYRDRNDHDRYYDRFEDRFEDWWAYRPFKGEFSWSWF